jgi:lysophospholipase L1-like esterase
MHIRLFCLIVFALSLGLHAEEPDPFYFKDGERIVFLGDSITQGGSYVSYVDAHLMRHYPEKHFTLINLGLSSETASGLSEPDHPFPRPCVHSRVDRALAESKPDWVVICYGMNDGIYYPFGEDRFQAYVTGMRALVAKCQAVGARVIVMTPPPFDAPSRKGPCAPAGLKEYGYKTPFIGYSDVLGQYAGWVMSLDGEVDRVVDIYTPMKKALVAKREVDPDYRSGDGIHPNGEGHWVMAETLLGRIKAPKPDGMPDYVMKPGDSELGPLLKKRLNVLSHAWREHVGHARSNQKPDLAAAIKEGAELEIRIRALMAAP